MQRKKEGHEITQLRASFVVQGFVFLALFIYWTKVIIRFSFPYCNFSFDWFFFLLLLDELVLIDWICSLFIFDIYDPAWTLFLCQNWRCSSDLLGCWKVEKLTYCYYRCCCCCGGEEKRRKKIGQFDDVENI